jgi:hypothetical protein
VIKEKPGSHGTANREKKGAVMVSTIKASPSHQSIWRKDDYRQASAGVKKQAIAGRVTHCLGYSLVSEAPAHANPLSAALGCFKPGSAPIIRKKGSSTPLVA